MNETQRPIARLFERDLPDVVADDQDEPLDLTQAQFLRRVNRVLEMIEFPNFGVEAREGHGGVYLVGRFYAPDNFADVKGAAGISFPVEQSTRKWLLSPFMTDSEIVQTAFKMILTAFEHEIREQFRYDGAPIFGPHFDVNDLRDLALTRAAAGARH